MGTFKLDFSITATNNNVSSCLYIWHRLVSNDNTVLGITNWTVDTFTSGNTFIVSEYLNNSNLNFCRDIYLEVYIMPCCAVAEILSGITCMPSSNCTVLPTSTPLPNVIPSTAIHQYLKVDISDIANPLSTYTGPSKLAKIPATVYANYERIRINCDSGCVLGSDILCNAVNNNNFIIEVWANTSYPAIAFYYCNSGLLVEGYNGTTWSNITSNVTIEPFYVDNKHCMFDTVLLQIRNRDSNNAVVAYQNKNGLLGKVTVLPNQILTVCCIRETWYLERLNGINYNNVDLIVLSSC